MQAGEEEGIERGQGLTSRLASSCPRWRVLELEPGLMVSSS